MSYNQRFPGILTRTFLSIFFRLSISRYRYLEIHSPPGNDARQSNNIPVFSLRNLSTSGLRYARLIKMKYLLFWTLGCWSGTQVLYYGPLFTFYTYLHLLGPLLWAFLHLLYPFYYGPFYTFLALYYVPFYNFLAPSNMAPSTPSWPSTMAHSTPSWPVFKMQRLAAGENY